ncbi:MAG: hypothetical protein JSS74_06070 [Actinobacteria bacterium]|nr:hypothetical protein [Actinomycetota bacterium]
MSHIPQRRMHAGTVRERTPRATRWPPAQRSPSALLIDPVVRPVASTGSGEGGGQCFNLRAIKTSEAVIAISPILVIGKREELPKMPMDA